MSKSFSTKFGNIPVVKKNKIEEESDSSVDSDESGTIYLSIKSILKVYWYLDLMLPDEVIKGLDKIKFIENTDSAVDTSNNLFNRLYVTFLLTQDSIYLIWNNSLCLVTSSIKMIEFPFEGSLKFIQ